MDLYLGLWHILPPPPDKEEVVLPLAVRPPVIVWSWDFNIDSEMEKESIIFIKRSNAGWCKQSTFAFDESFCCLMRYKSSVAACLPRRSSLLTQNTSLWSDWQTVVFSWWWGGFIWKLVSVFLLGNPNALLTRVFLMLFSLSPLCFCSWFEICVWF